MIVLLDFFKRAQTACQHDLASLYFGCCLLKAAVLASNITWNVYNAFGGRSNYINTDKLPDTPTVNSRQDLQRYTAKNFLTYQSETYAPLSFDRPEPINFVPEDEKPENIIEKMVEGRMRKYYEDVCLLEQTYVIDGESKVGDAVKKAAKDVGAEVTVTGFRRFALGEGIEKKQEDFAAEVAAVTKH
mgnify:CR=1 FL=1